jgi:hypothetical protein
VTEPRPEDLAVAAAQEAVNRALDRGNAPTVKPGTVVDWSHDSEPVAVVLDGDDDPIVAANGTAGSLRRGSRVLVLLYPPAGSIVVGFVGGYVGPQVSQVGAAPATAVANNTRTVLPFGTLTGDLDVLVPFSGALAVQAAGRYRIEATINYGDASATGHRLVTFRRNFATAENLDQRPGAPTGNTISTVIADLDLTLYETLDVEVRQTTGAATNCQLTRFVMERIGPPRT